MGLVLSSILGLYLELLLIRWISSEIRIFAYFKNFVLIACFLGFGSGCLLYRRPRHILRTLLLFLVLCLLIQLQWQPLVDYGPRRISRILAEMPGLMVFYGVDPVLSWSGASRLAFGPSPRELAAVEKTAADMDRVGALAERYAEAFHRSSSLSSSSRASHCTLCAPVSMTTSATAR